MGLATLDERTPILIKLDWRTASDELGLIQKLTTGWTAAMKKTKSEISLKV